MPFKKGQSGNPNGRPPKTKNKIISNKALKDSLKKGCTEAFSMTMDYLKEYRGDAKTAKKLASELIEQILLEEDLTLREGLTNELRLAVMDKDKAMDKALKASFKILDSTFTVMLQEERLEVTRKSSDNGDEDDEELDDIPAPVLQLTSVK
jgi:hypothetical protein